MAQKSVVFVCAVSYLFIIYFNYLIGNIISRLCGIVYKLKILNYFNRKRVKKQQK